MSFFYQNRSNEFKYYVSINNIYPLHLHKQIEIMYILSGSADITIDNKTQTLENGSLAIAFPNILHCVKTKGQSRILFIIFNTDMSSDYSNELLTNKTANPFIKSSYIHKDLKNSIESIADKKIQENKKLLKAYINLIIGHILVISSLNQKTIKESSDISQKLLTYIDNNFTQHITLDTAAKKIGINKFYISHIFSEKLNTTFVSYLNGRRIEYAKNLLSSTDLSVTEIGFEAGFSSSRTFYRTFKAICGKTPKDYRKEKIKKYE